MKKLILIITAITLTSCATQKDYAIQWKDPKTNEIKQSKDLDSLKASKHVNWLKNRHNIDYVVVKLNK